MTNPKTSFHTNNPMVHKSVSQYIKIIHRDQSHMSRSHLVLEYELYKSRLSDEGSGTEGTSSAETMTTVRDGHRHPVSEINTNYVIIQCFAGCQLIVTSVILIIAMNCEQNNKHNNNILKLEKTTFTWNSIKYIKVYYYLCLILRFRFRLNSLWHI